jgi:hypothetical protein
MMGSPDTPRLTHAIQFHMTITNFVYVAIPIVYALVLAYMFLYNTHLHTRQRTLALKGRQPMSREEGIAIATLENEREGHTGSIWTKRSA